MRAVLFALTLLVADAAQAFGGAQLSIEHDGVARTALLDASPGLRDAPLLIVLHGGIGSASFVRRRAGVSLAQRGWVVAWPEADGDWSDGRRTARGTL